MQVDLKLNKYPKSNDFPYLARVLNGQAWGGAVILVTGISKHCSTNAAGVVLTIAPDMHKHHFGYGDNLISFNYLEPLNGSVTLSND